MSDSTEPLGTVQQSQSQKETTVNAKLNAVSPASYFGLDEESSAGLRWYYFSAVCMVAGVRTRIPAGYLDLTPSTTCYIEHTTSGVVSFNTSGFTAGRVPDYRVVTGASTITSWEDLRMGASSAEDILAALGIDSWTVGGSGPYAITITKGAYSTTLDLT
jgi:hypothetical protein